MITEYVERIVATASAWDGVQSQPHRFGGTEFVLGKVEIGHVHRRNAMVDIPYTRAIREQLVAEGHTGLHHLLPDTGWTTFYAHNEAQTDKALWLLRLSYAHKRYARQRHDTAGIATFTAELDALQVSPTLRAVLMGKANTTDESSDLSNDEQPTIG
jgi:hypothetical protein